MNKPTRSIPFTAYQKLAVFLLTITQFTVILDFMVMSPLGDILMKSLDLKPSRFGFVVSAYAFSAGFSGLLTAGFADKFDRKKTLIVFLYRFYCRNHSLRSRYLLPLVTVSSNRYWFVWRCYWFHINGYSCRFI